MRYSPAYAMALLAYASLAAPANATDLDTVNAWIASDKPWMTCPRPSGTSNPNHPISSSSSDRRIHVATEAPGASLLVQIDLAGRVCIQQGCTQHGRANRDVSAERSPRMAAVAEQGGDVVGTGNHKPPAQWLRRQ